MRCLPLLAGLALLAAVWIGPVPALAEGSFAAHMAMHVVAVGLAPPLIATGIAGSAADPVRRWPAWLAPIPAAAVDFAVVWGWHAPALNLAARSDGGLLALEQASFLAAGLLVWLSAFGGTPAQRRQRAGAGILGLLATSMHMTMLGVLLATAGQAEAGDAGIAGLGPLADRHLGGVLMLAVAGSAYLAGGLVLLARLLADPAAEAESEAETERRSGR